MQYCAGCGKQNDAHSSISEDAKPEHGALSICAYCGQVNTFDANLKLQKISQEEWNDLKKFHLQAYMQIIIIQRAIKERIKQN